MKIETLKSISYSRGAHLLCVLVQAANQLQVTNALVGKEALHVYADNEGEDKLVEVLQGYQYLIGIIQLPDNLFEVHLTDEELTPQTVKGKLLSEVEDYDKSEAVNSFTLAGKQMWLDKDTRVGLMNSINIEKSAGRVETNLWFGGMRFTFPVDDALAMLYALELYALECYNVTQEHIAAIKELTTKEEVEAYLYKTGYPEKLRFAESTNDNTETV